MNQPRIVFMGSSNFSVKSLSAMCKNGMNIVSVYTQPPKPAGRNYKLTKSAVHEFADANGLNVYTPSSLKQADQEEYLRDLNPDVAVVSSYGLIIPQRILDIPKLGFINIHASILPRWRGASPIQAAILAGDLKSGITIMKMDAGIDTGDMISVKTIDMTEKTTFAMLESKLGDLGASMIVEVLGNLQASLAAAYKQPDSGAIYVKKLTKDFCRIDWNKDAKEVLQHIMAFSPLPSAWSMIDGLRIKILDADITQCGAEREQIKSGISAASESIAEIDRSGCVKCGNGVLKLNVVHPDGKKQMTFDAFLRGKPNLIGKKFE